MQYTVQDRQNLVDIAIQHYGHADYIVLLVNDNPGLDYDSELVAGQVVNVRSAPADRTARQVRDYFAAKKISIATTVPVIPGSAPVASNVIITGTIAVGFQGTVQYTYSDADSDPEGATQILWYQYASASDASNHTNPTQIGTGGTFTFSGAQAGAWIRAGVTPVSSTGVPATGAEVLSPAYQVEQVVLQWQTTGTGVVSWQMRISNGVSYDIDWGDGTITSHTGTGAFQVLTHDYEGATGTKTVRVYASSPGVITGLEWTHADAYQTGSLDISSLDNLTNFATTGNSSLNNFGSIAEPTLVRNMERYAVNQALFTAINPQNWVGDVTHPNNSASFIIANLPNLNSLDLGSGTINNGLVSLSSLTCPILGTRTAGGSPRIFTNNNTNFYTWSGACTYISCANNTFGGIADLSGLTCSQYFEVLNNSFSEIKEPVVTGSRITVSGNAITVYTPNPGTTGLIDDFDFRNQAASSFPSLATYNFKNNASINIENNVLSQSQSDAALGELVNKAGGGPVAWNISAGGSNTDPPTGPGSNYEILWNAGATVTI